MLLTHFYAPTSVLHLGLSVVLGWYKLPRTPTPTPNCCRAFAAFGSKNQKRLKAKLNFRQSSCTDFN